MSLLKKRPCAREVAWSNITAKRCTEDIEEILAFTRDPEDTSYVLAATLVRASYLLSGEEDMLRMDTRR